MDFLDRLLRRKANKSDSLTDSAPMPASSTKLLKRYKHKDLQLPQNPLTPREIEEIHAKQHPWKHDAYMWGPSKQRFDSRDWNLPFALSLEEKLDTLGQHTLLSTQSRSLMFSRLPREVRIQIWCYAIGSQELYFNAEHGRLVQAGKMDDFKWWPKRGLLNVPMICRAAYVESIACLYSCNTFCYGFGHQGTKLPLTSLDTMIPQQHVASIRHIKVGWHFIRGYSQYYDSHPQAWDLSLNVCEPDRDEVWGEVCAKLAQLANLKSLEIVIWTSGNLRAEFMGQEKDILAQLSNIRHLEYFHILLPWTQDDHTLWNDGPFSISRKFEDRERFGVSVPLLEVPVSKRVRKCADS